MLTRIFKSGNSLPVCIPKELAFEGGAQDVDIERAGNTLVLRPVVTETIGDLSDIFAAFPKGFMAEGRELHEQRERDWGGSGLGTSVFFMRYMLDTNTCIYLNNAHPPHVVQQFKTATSGQIVMSVVT